MGDPMNLAGGNEDAERLKEQVEFLKFAYEQKKLPVCLIGGFGDDVHLKQAVSQGRHDMDMVALRQYSDIIKGELQRSGFNVEEVVVPPADNPYKFRVTKGKLRIDIAFLEWDTEKMKPG